MPDFTFDLPDGRSGTVTAPEGTTPEQAYGYLQQQMKMQSQSPQEKPVPATAPAKPATASDRAKDAIAGLRQANPLNRLDANDKPVPPPTLSSAAKSIASSTAFGGIAGALSPEIVSSLGVAASFLPYVGEAVGPALIETGAALKAGRWAEAGIGAASGLTSEAAGQATQALGGSRTQADIARVAGGMLTPSAGTVAGFVGKPVKLAWDFAQKALGGAQDISKAVATARENLAKLAEAGQPQTAMHAMLQKGVEADRQAAEKAADAVLADAHQRAAAIARSDAGAATRIIDDARTHAESIRADAAKRAAALDKASDGKLATANRVLAQAAPELAKVGQVSELSDIGNTLRQAATAKQGAEIQARNEAYQATVVERDAAVKAKEEAGEHIGQTPAMAALKKDLKGKLVGQGGFAKTTDAGVRRVYQQVYDAVNPQKQKLSFEAVDQVRRRLGDVIAGNQTPEGYEAIGVNAAKKMYAQISKAQEEFVGEAGGKFTPVKSNFEPDTKWMEKQVSVGKNSILADKLTNEKDIGNGLKISKDPGYGGAYKVYAPSGVAGYPWKVVGKLSYDNGKIVNLAVSPEFQKQGIAQKLIKEASDAKAVNPNLDPEDVSQAGANAINRFRQSQTKGYNPQRKLQSEYAKDTEELAKFESKSGQKATAVQRLNQEQYNADPKTLPRYFFNSQQSIRDAKELTGNPQLVDRQAADYTARSMQGQSAAQAKKWVRDNQDWMREVPGLTARANAYANKLEQIERVNSKLTARATTKAKEAEQTRIAGTAAAEAERQAGIQRASKAAEGAAATQQRLAEEGSKAATAAREEKFAPAKGLETILKSGESPEAVRSLLLNGKPEQTRLAARYLAGQPGGKEVLEQSVRQTMRNMTEGNLRQQWTERIRPMLADGKMIPPERLKALESDVNRLLAAYKGKDRLSLVQRHIAAAIGTAAGPNTNY